MYYYINLYMLNLRLFSLSIMSAFLSLNAFAFTPKIKTESVFIGKSECGDSCVLTIYRGKQANEYYVCYPADMYGPKALQVCKDLFVRADKSLPNVYQRKVTLKLASIKDSDNYYHILSGHLHPDPNARPVEKKPQNNKQFNGWDNWLELTGNKAKVAPQIAETAITVSGSAPADVKHVKKACQHLVNHTGPGQAGIGAIYSLTYLSQVDGSTVYGNMGPQVKLTPVKIYAKYRDGENLYINAYIQKDTFGELKCFVGR